MIHAREAKSATGSATPAQLPESESSPASDQPSLVSLPNIKRQEWVAIDVVAPIEAREACEYGLMEAGALGTETQELDHGRVQVSGYFADCVDELLVQDTLLEAFRIYEVEGLPTRTMTTRAVANRDWLAEWKKDWQPVEVGERFLVAPPWSEITNAGSRIVIRIEPGMAFGTGTHETTRLCLRAIEKYFKGGSFIDVGTGTGILAIAAAKLFPHARVEACDTDIEALAIARENARLNKVAGNIVFRVGTIENQTASADCVCANLTTDAILPLLSSLLGATCGRLILSGILVEQIDAVRSRLLELDVSDLEVVQDGEWAAMIL